MKKSQCFSVTLFLTSLWVNLATSSSNVFSLFYNKNPEDDIVSLMKSKKYLPDEKVLFTKDTNVGTYESDTNLILSKLSDNDIISLLSKQPLKQEFSLDELNNISQNSKDNHSFKSNVQYNKLDSDSPVFRLEHKPINSHLQSEKDTTYEALQNLIEVMKNRQQEQTVKDVDEEQKKELMFNVLVSQLKSLCCKKDPPNGLNSNANTYSLPLLNNNFNRAPNEILEKNENEQMKATLTKVSVEHMFIVINDDIDTSQNVDGIIPVDPNSLDERSSVLLLGPLSKSLTDLQLRKVMSRLTDELKKTQYLPLLQQISDGTIKHKNIQVMKSLIAGPNTRRYIKPHRCNYQSKLARVHGIGPRWVICTGYININQPSLYD